MLPEPGSPGSFLPQKYKPVANVTAYDSDAAKFG